MPEKNVKVFMKEKKKEILVVDVSVFIKVKKKLINFSLKNIL